jgi:hypothetical protein
MKIAMFSVKVKSERMKSIMSLKARIGNLTSQRK